MKTIISIKKCGGFLAAMALAGAFAAPAAAQNVMKLSTATINDSQHEWIKLFAAAVEKGSNGKIKPEIYPASQLGAIPRQIEGVQFGSIQVWVGPPEFLVGVDSRYEVLSAPGLFKDSNHFVRTFQDPEFSKAFLALGANRGLKGLGLFLSGPIVFNTRSQLQKPADVKGMKIRVLASPMQMKQLEALGASGVPMSLGEVMPALQQGAIDGVLSTTPVFTALRFYGAAKYLYETNHGMVSSIAVVSKGWFDKLSPDLQKIVTDAAQQTSKEIGPWALNFIASQRAAWIKAGGVVTEPTTAERAQIMKLMAPIGTEVTKAKAPEKAMFELMLKAAKRAE
ncbi:MAG: TRAP transporter substrate-binding protein [Betaproteobacteria bacterium]|nr:TRAP transporter substrate-binding protein [Betaproteobacteria bacterium]